MRRPLVKVNVEPAYLTASIRCFDLRNSPPTICVECQMTDRHYEDQLHPLSCDGGGSDRPTGSPRPLSHLAADAGALAIAQIVGSPAVWANRWWGRQWQQNLLGGGGSFSELEPNPNCRWDHNLGWQPLIRLTESGNVTLRQMAADAKINKPSLQIEFSARIATCVICPECGKQQQGIWWVAELDQPAAKCVCGGNAVAVPFYTHKRLPAAELKADWDQPLADWGVTPGAVLQFTSASKQAAYCLPALPSS
jgi:hypothetical protein